MQQDIKFTECLTWMTWFLLVTFDTTHTDKHTGHTPNNRLTHLLIYINTTCYVHTAPTCIALNE